MTSHQDAADDATQDHAPLGPVQPSRHRLTAKQRTALLAAAFTAFGATADVAQLLDATWTKLLWAVLIVLAVVAAWRGVKWASSSRWRQSASLSRRLLAVIVMVAFLVGVGVAAGVRWTVDDLKSQSNAASTSAVQNASNAPPAGPGQPVPSTLASAVPGPSGTGSGTSPVASPAGTNSCPSTTQAPVQDLRFQITAVKVDKYTVRVTPIVTGQPRAGLWYWFMLKVDYNGGYVEYYPRRTLSAQCIPFEVSISPKADLQYSRFGQVFALNGAQNADAEQRLARQSTTMVDDYFTIATGEAISNVVALPFG